MATLQRPKRSTRPTLRFQRLAKAWRSETELISKVSMRVMHPAYQTIIGMGEAAIPLILKDLAEHGPDDWFWALTAITEENPITSQIAGDMVAMTESWLQWGRDAGYLKKLPKSTQRLFPDLMDYVVTSAKDKTYNCIALLPSGTPLRKWDAEMLPHIPATFGCRRPLKMTTTAYQLTMARMFVHLGYTVCDNGNLEAGWQKVALYAFNEDNWLHAAIQESSGEWSSKLGNSYDIRHKTPPCVEGPVYGKVMRFMKRQIKR